MKNLIRLLCFMMFLAISITAQKIDFPKLNGPYLGQKPPGNIPEVFAPEIISTKEYKEFSGTFTPDGKEYYFFRLGEDAGLMECKLTRDGWTAPWPVQFKSSYIDYEPHITYDGNLFFFSSNRLFPGCGEGRLPMQVWMMRKMDDAWSGPIHLRMGMAATSTEDDRIYIGSSIYELNNDSLVSVGEIIYNNSVEPSYRLPSNHTCISKDESFCLFDYKETLYVNFRGKDDKWNKPINLNESFNLNGAIILPTLSPDNKYIFFSYKGDIYWVSASIIEILKQKE
ncbi:MAG: hypothetical protein V1720_12350 [bacterium]